MKKGGFVYILTNKRRTVYYTGVTASLSKRVWEHKEKINPGCFTARYNCDILIYYCGFHHIAEAIAEETRIKGLRRSKKLELIHSMNPLKKDLFPDLVE
jgi:putative endonuclease